MKMGNRLGTLGFFSGMLSIACGVMVAACAGAEYEVVDDLGEVALDEERLAEAESTLVIDYNLTNIGSAIGTPVATGTTCGLVNEYTPMCAVGNAPDSSYYWTAPATGAYKISTAGSTFNTVLHVYAGIPSNSPKGCDDDVGGTLQSSVTLNATAGQSYTFVVDGAGSACGNFNLNITAITMPQVGPRLWLRGEDGVTTSNGYVAQWADQSGNSNHASMNIAGRQPKVVPGALNGKPVIRFSGAQSLHPKQLLQPKQFTVFVVGKNSKMTEDFSMILGPAGGSDNNQLRWANGTQTYAIGLGSNMPAVTTSIGNTRVYHALTLRYDLSQETMQVYRDGILKSTSYFTMSDTWDINQIAAWSSTYYMIGDLAEIMFYFAPLTETERGQVNNYLRGKYELP